MKQINGIWVEKPSSSVIHCLENGKEYHEGMLKYASTLCNKHRKAVDVGACYGLITLQMADIFETVEAFEPHPTTLQCLKRNTQDLPGVTTYDVGLAHLAGTKRLYYLDNDGRTSFVRPPVEKVFRSRDTFDTTMVESRTLDSYDFQDVDLIKVDVEAYEEFVIKGALKTLASQRPVLILEEKQGKRSTAYCIEALKLLGYKAMKRFRDRDTVYAHRQGSG